MSSINSAAPLKRIVRKLDLWLPGADPKRLVKDAIILDLVDGLRTHFATFIKATMKALLTALFSRTVLINFDSIPIKTYNCVPGYICIY